MLRDFPASRSYYRGISSFFAEGVGTNLERFVQVVNTATSERDVTVSESTSKTLLDRIQSGDELAAEELLKQFADRLVALARSRLSRKLSRRVDPEDVVQSACRSFFRHAYSGRYQTSDGDDLWRLLATITIRKSAQHARLHNAKRRTVRQEESAACGGPLQLVAPEALAREPSPEEATALLEETQETMRSLSELHRRILELTLQGHSVDEVAERAKCSERTVERALKLARDRLKSRLKDV